MDFEEIEETRNRLHRGRLDDDEDEDDDGEEKAEDKISRESVLMLDLLRKERTLIISEQVTPKLTQRIISQLLWLDSAR
jgi:hypothetical protein